MASEKTVDVSLDTSISHRKTIVEDAADATLRLVEQYGDTVEPLTPEAEKKLKRKLQFHILTLLCFINVMLFVDKATLSYSSFLGVMAGTHINDTQYNNLSTIFYVGYIVAQFPGHWLMQRLPLGKFVAASVFIWSIIIFLHCTAKSYGGLIPLRFFLGIFEAVLVPSMEMTMGMFFTPDEALRIQPIFWISCVGAPIPAGFIAYGLIFSKSTIPAWKLFMIITGGITFFLAIYSWFFYPSNPAKARFLTLEEKIQVIRRVHDATKSSIEQKKFKKHQFMEALRDPISWLFLLAAFCLMTSNNLTFQQSLIFVKIGVSDLGSTLVSAAGGGFAVVCSILAALLLKWAPNRAAYWATFWCLPSIAGGIGMVALSWDKRISLLACLTLAGNTYANSYIIALGWTSASAAGYTKKLTRNVLFMAGYGISNIISPQIWVARDGPRYYGAWIAQILVSWVGTPICLLIINWILSRRNKERRAWILEQSTLGNHGIGYVEQLNDEGQLEKVEVDISLLDLTDLENKFFIYPL